MRENWKAVFYGLLCGWIVSAIQAMSGGDWSPAANAFIFAVLMANSTTPAVQSRPVLTILVVFLATFNLLAMIGRSMGV